MTVQQNDSIKALDKERESLQSENKLLKEKCDRLSQEVENLNISLKTKFQEYESSVGELEKKNMKLKEDCEKSGIDVINLNKTHSDILKQKEKQIEELEQKVVTCSLQINELHDRCTQTDNALKHAEFKYSDLKQIKEKTETEELSVLSLQNHELSTKLESLENRIKDKELDYEELSQKCRELEKSFVVVQTENKELLQNCKHIELKKKAMQAKYSQLVQTSNETEEKLQKAISNLSSMNNDLNEKCGTHVTHIQNLNIDIEKIDQVKATVEQKLKEISERNRDVECSLKEVQDENRVLSKKIETNNCYSDQVCCELENLKQIHKNCEDCIVKLKTENKSLTHQLTEETKQLETLQQSHKEFMEELEQTQKSLLKLQEDHFELNNKKEMLEKENDQMKQQRERLSQEINNLSDELACVEQERNSYFASKELKKQIMKNSKEPSVTTHSKESKDAHYVHVQDNHEAVDSHLTERAVHVNDAKEIKESNKNDDDDDDKKEAEEDDELISEEELEILIQQRIDHEKKQIEYDLEEKYEIQFRKRQVELMHTFEKKQKELQKDFEQHVNHRVESLRAEKDQSFVKALQKVKKDFDKKLKKEMEKQRLAHLQELATIEDERKGGGHISGVVKNLLQENQELAEARDALLQQVELSHHQQDKLEDELRSMMGENIEGEGEFLQEPVKLNTEQPRQSYRSQSLLLDWEFSPSTSFEQDKDPPGLSGQFENDCQNLQCLMLRRKYQELRNTVQLSGFQPEINIAEDFHSAGPGFKPEIVDYLHNESETDLSTPTTELEASFVKEALRKAAESFSEVNQSTSCSTPTVDAFIENVGSKDDIFKSSKFKSESVTTTEEFLPIRVRSLSLNLPQDTDLMDNDNISEVDKKESSFMRHVRHHSLDRFIGQNLETEGKFVAEFFHDQTPLSQLNKSQDRISQSSDGKLKVNCVSKRNSWNSSRSSQTSLSQGDLQLSIDHVTESKTEKSKHNSQGEFFVEYISGDLETLDPNTLNEIAAIQSNSPHLGEVTPHFDFTLELTKDEKLDNDKLLKKLESLKNIYCKEKQDLMSKCENLTIQLENESLSRRQLEQELINISEDFGETITKPETEVSINSQGENNAKLPPKKTLTAKNTLKKESVPKPCHFESMIKSLECELHEKEDSLKQQNIEVGMGEALQEQRLNEMKVLFKSELRKLEVENSSLLEQKYQLENQNLEQNKQSESKASRGGNSKSCISVDSQTNELELINEKHLQKKQQLIEQLEAHNSKLESDSELLFVKEKEKEMTIKELTEKCQNLEMEAQEKVQLVEQLDQQCASYKLKLQTTGHDSSEMKQVGSFIELQEKCKNLELELERAKQNETFACVYEEKCKQLESDLENQQDYKQDLMEMTEKFERLEKEYKEQNVNHLQELNSCTSVIEKLRQKCENIDSLVANERKLSQETSVQCEHYQKELTVKQTLLKELEEKSSKNDIQLEELSNKCANLTDSLQIQKHKNNRLKKENVENCKKYEAEISHKERALDEINDTCSKFEIAEYENEHVIQELTTQCQKYQSEIQALRAKELLKMKKTLSCSVDEIESTDYHEFIVDSSTCVFDDEEEKIPDEKRENKSESEFDNKVKEDILIQERASYVETGINDMSGTYGRVTELETLLKDKDALIRKYETELDQRNDELDRMDDLRQYQEHLEMSVREKDSYIKQLEEHFLQQRTPVSIRSTVKPCKLGNVGQHRNDEPAGITCSTPTMNMPENIHSSEMELQDNLSDQSTISGENSFTKQKSQDSLLSDKTDNDGNFVTHSKFNDSLLSDSKNHNTQTLSALSESGSGRSDEASYSQMDMKHFAIVEEISKLRQDLRETKSVYTQENALLREALDKEKWNRDSKLESQNVEQHFSSEVGNLQQKVSLLKETNDMLRKENDEWLKRVQEQETIVLQLREQLGCDVNKDENKCDQSFNQQLKLLQQQRNELVERLGDSENKIGSLAQSLSEKSISEENLRCEKAKLQTKLYEMEEVEKELTEKKIELENKKQHKVGWRKLSIIEI
ncbi:unnamed protein product [Mytilus coruscus]|uniref:Uncharacterized protein n=1 Tax=Mytilus coruscus TaxID=42192 RepID=A0A6J8BIS2_MYTCO|nr:unnamed protein product [Mytilus coruscus]